MMCPISDSKPSCSATRDLTVVDERYDRGQERDRSDEAIGGETYGVNVYRRQSNLGQILQLRMHASATAQQHPQLLSSSGPNVFERFLLLLPIETGFPNASPHGWTNRAHTPTHLEQGDQESRSSWQDFVEGLFVCVVRTQTRRGIS